MEHTYAKALQSLASADQADAKQLVASLVAHLEAHGRLKLLPGILRELKRLQIRAQAADPRIEVATEAEIEKAIGEAQKAGITAPSATVNPELISGWRARSDGLLVDRSGKRALVDLYRSITKQR